MKATVDRLNRKIMVSHEEIDKTAAMAIPGAATRRTAPGRDRTLAR
jgi:hypothetical protein